jgi:hypothetical protein
MEAIFEFIFSVLGELLLQLVIELLFEFGLRSIREPFRHEPRPWLAALGYAMLGAIAGAISLALKPSLMIDSEFGRLVNLGLTPVLMGCVMAAVGALRRSRDQELIRIDRFAYGYLFALAMAFVRFWFGQ